MASGRQECSICMDNFKNPKLITCHHSFCYKCLDDYIRVNLHNGQFPCPICRTSVKLPNSGISGFQSNFYIDEADNRGKFYFGMLQRIEARVKTLEEELSNTRKQYAEAHDEAKTKGLKLTETEKEIQTLRNQREEAVAQAKTKGLKLTETEKEIQTLRNQRDEAVAQTERVSKPRNKMQIKAFHSHFGYSWSWLTDAELTGRMCIRCQGWIEKEDFGFNCQCGDMKN